VGACVVPERLHHAGVLEGHGVAMAVEGAASGDADPALADAVLLDVLALLAVEQHADPALQGGGVVEGALRIDGEAVGRRVGHRKRSVCGRARRIPARRRNASPGPALRVSWAFTEPAPAPPRQASAPLPGDTGPAMTARRHAHFDRIA